MSFAEKTTSTTLALIWVVTIERTTLQLTSFLLTLLHPLNLHCKLDTLVLIRFIVVAVCVAICDVVVDHCDFW